MRSVLALILILILAPLASADEREASQTDLSSHWAQEEGAQNLTDKRSRADFFLKSSFGTREVQSTHAVQSNHAVPESQSKATETN